jgi:hypothetical protein
VPVAVTATRSAFISAAVSTSVHCPEPRWVGVLVAVAGAAPSSETVTVGVVAVLAAPAVVSEPKAIRFDVFL